MNTARRRLLRSRCLAVLAAASFVLSAAAQGGKSAGFFEDALQRFEKQDYAGAVLQLKNALQADRKMLQAHVLLGRALLANGEVNAAQAAFEEALRLGVNPTEVVLPLAQTLIGQGQPAAVLSDPRLAHANLPSGPKGQMLLTKAAAASDTGDTRLALRLLEEARALDAGSAESWAAEVPVRVRARQLKEARAAAEKAVALAPQSAGAVYQLASVAHVAGDLKTAIALYSRAITLRPDFADALVARAGLYVDVGRLEEAKADVQAARQALPQDPRSIYLAALLAERARQPAEVTRALAEVTAVLDPIPLEFIRYRPQVLMLGGLAHYGLNQHEKARPYLEMVLRQDAGSPVSKLLAQIYVRDKRFDLAVEALELYLRQQPNDRQALIQLASSNMSLGRYARAAQMMQKALSQGDDPAMRTLLGMSLVGAGKFTSAAAELEATLKRDPGQQQAGVTLAGLYMSSGQAAKAVALAEGLVKRNPKSPGLANLLGQAHARKGDIPAARAAFEQALKLAPDFTEATINLARLDIDQKAFPAAQQRLNAVLAADERHVDAAMEAARLASALGRADDALRWLLRADDHGGPRLQPGMQIVEFHLARGRPDLAREAVKRLQEKAPDAMAVLLLQARTQLASADAPGAKSTLSRAATNAGFDPAALVQIAQLQVHAGDVAGAAHALDKALLERPTHLVARALRAEVDLRQNDPASAERRARAIVADEPKLGMGHALLGDIARARGQDRASIDAYRRAHQLDQSADSLLRLMNALEAIDQRAQATAQAEQWLKSRPNDSRILRALADSQARAGNLAAARAAYESLVKRLPGDADALNNLANLLVALKDPAALRTAERALALKPELPHVIGTTGWAAFHAGQPDRALQLLREARLRDPNNASTRYFLGAVLADRGRREEARAELEGALRDGGRFAYAKQAESLLSTLR